MNCILRLKDVRRPCSLCSGKGAMLGGGAFHESRMCAAVMAELH